MQQEPLRLIIKDISLGLPDDSHIRRIDYSNDDFALLSTNLLTPGHSGAGLSSRIYAYKVAGNAPGKPFS